MQALTLILETSFDLARPLVRPILILAGISALFIVPLQLLSSSVA